jgi:outer membrane protein assembly factor BamB
MPSPSIFRLSLVLLISAVASYCQAQDIWPQFRGPHSCGYAEDHPNLPEVWSATQNIVWKTEIPGLGWSSPIVWKDKVFVTSVIKEGEVEPPKKGLYLGGERPAPEDVHRWMVYCIEFGTGKVLWEKEAHQGIPEGSRHMKNSYASETPVTDGERVYAYFGNTGLFAYDMEGNLLWNKKWDPVKTNAGWGTAASPILFKDRLIVVNDNDTHSYMAALDAKTGDPIWQVDREEESNWSTPFIWENEKRTELVTAGTKKNRGYDLEGKLLWEFSGNFSITIATPFSKSGLLFLSSGFILDSKKPIYAVRPGASGDFSLKDGETSNEWIAWKQPMAAPYNPSTLAYGDYLYVLLDRGFLACYNLKTGDEVYEKQRLARGGAYTASPWAYNGKVFCLSEEGDTHVVQSGPEFKPVRTNSLDEMCLATPAIADGSLILRTASHLYRIESPDTAGR